MTITTDVIHQLPHTWISNSFLSFVPLIAPNFLCRAKKVKLNFLQKTVFMLNEMQMATFPHAGARRKVKYERNKKKIRINIIN